LARVGWCVVSAARAARLWASAQPLCPAHLAGPGCAIVRHRRSACPAWPVHAVYAVHSVERSRPYPRWPPRFPPWSPLKGLSKSHRADRALPRADIGGSIPDRWQLNNTPHPPYSPNSLNYRQSADLLGNWRTRPYGGPPSLGLCYRHAGCTTNGWHKVGLFPWTMEALS
jgi:hypothetical protein